VAPTDVVMVALVPVGEILYVPGRTQIVVLEYCGVATAPDPMIAVIAAGIVAYGKPPMYAVESLPYTWSTRATLPSCVVGIG